MVGGGVLGLTCMDISGVSKKEGKSKCMTWWYQEAESTQPHSPPPIEPHFKLFPPALCSLEEFESLQSLGSLVVLQCPGHLEGTPGCESHAENEQSLGLSVS